MLDKDPQRRITIRAMRDHAWVLQPGAARLPSIEENCSIAIEVTDEEVGKAVRPIVSLKTLVRTRRHGRRRRPVRLIARCRAGAQTLLKQMGKHRSLCRTRPLSQASMSSVGSTRESVDAGDGDTASETNIQE